MFVHSGFEHILSNMLLFLAVSIPLEVKYGTGRVVLCWFLATTGGSLLSVALENPCIQVRHGHAFWVVRALPVVQLLPMFHPLQVTSWGCHSHCPCGPV